MLLQVDRLQAIPAPLKPRWDTLFLDLLHQAIANANQVGAGGGQGWGMAWGSTPGRQGG